jgi:glycosyltransferase involved in cell wall biosynthesis
MTLPKLAYLTGEYPRASDTFIQREVAALRALGHDVLTCSIRTTGAEHLVGPEQRAEHAGTFKVLDACRGPRLLAAHLRWMRRPRRYLRALALAWRTAHRGVAGRIYALIYFAEAGVLADHMARRGVEHLHNHIAKSSCTVAMLASALSDIPYSFTIHGPDIFFEPHRWRIDEKAARAAFVVCISDFCRSQLMCFADRAHWDRFRVVHCGIEPARYRASAHRGKRLLFTGRLAAVKGLPVLLEALRDLQDDWRLTVIGDGPDRTALQAQAAGLPVDFVGYRSQAEVAEALALTDVFVLPSFAEGVPVVLMEAMAAGVPVVATRIAGVPELVEDGVHGRLVTPGNAKALRDAIACCLQDPDRRRRMGAAARAKVATAFDAGTEAARLSHLFARHAAGMPVGEKRPETRR